MEIVAILLSGLILLGIWVVSTRQRLIYRDENVNNAMGQVGIQLSSRFDALMALLSLAKEYAPGEARMLMETVKAKRNVITEKSVPNEVQEQERVIEETLACIELIAKHYPELGADLNYEKYMNALDCYEKMLCIGRLIYNDSVTKLNKEVRMLPTGLIAGILGFREKRHLECVGEKRNKSA